MGSGNARQWLRPQWSFGRSRARLQKQQIANGNQDGHLKDESDNDMSGDIGASAAANDSITVNEEPLVQTS